MATTAALSAAVRQYHPDLIKANSLRAQRNHHVVQQICCFFRRALAVIIREREDQLRGFLAELLESQIAISEQLPRVALTLRILRTRLDHRREPRERVSVRRLIEA